MPTISGITVRQTAYDATIKKTVTKIDRRPTRRTKDHLLTKVKTVLLEVGVTGFEWASKYGLLTKIIGAAEYKKLTGIIYKDLPENDSRERVVVTGSDRRIYENFMAA